MPNHEAMGQALYCTPRNDDSETKAHSCCAKGKAQAEETPSTNEEGKAEGATFAANFGANSS
jgi:hypothetical protein